MNTDDLLKIAVEKGASDIHVTVGVPMILRVSGRLCPINDIVLKSEDTARIVRDLTTETQFKNLNRKGEIDFSYSLQGISRFRVSAYRQRNNYSAAIRIISNKVKSFSELGLPGVVDSLTKLNHGLILVTGPTGSGKSTTLACMIEEINTMMNKHIITLEDPIEYLFRHKKSIINQREIGTDCLSFSNGLRAALRQDPDVILVGEMRDYETISVALTAAETGHLVISTLHTIGSGKSIDRIIDVFPPHQQQQIRVQLSLTLQAVVSQQLLVRSDGMGRVPAVEVMIANPAIRNLIREGKIHQVNNVIQTSASEGMKTMDDSLCELYRKGLISREEAFAHCIEADYMKKML